MDVSAVVIPSLKGKYLLLDVVFAPYSNFSVPFVIPSYRLSVIGLNVKYRLGCDYRLTAITDVFDQLTDKSTMM